MGRRSALPCFRPELPGHLLPVLPVRLLDQWVLSGPGHIIRSQPTAATSVCPLGGKISALAQRCRPRYLSHRAFSGIRVVSHAHLMRFGRASRQYPLQVLGKQLANVVRPLIPPTVRPMTSRITSPAKSAATQTRAGPSV